MDPGDLKSLYLCELQELGDCEAQFGKVLPMMASSAGFVELRFFIQQHARQTLLYEQRIKTLLRRHNSSLKTGVDQVGAALAKKAEQINCSITDPDLRDAALVATMRRIEHHQISAYDLAGSYADILSLSVDRSSLVATLQEKKTTDYQLANLQRQVNYFALLVSASPYW